MVMSVTPWLSSTDHATKSLSTTRFDDAASHRMQLSPMIGTVCKTPHEQHHRQDRPGKHATRWHFCRSHHAAIWKRSARSNGSWRVGPVDQRGFPDEQQVHPNTCNCAVGGRQIGWVGISANGAHTQRGGSSQIAAAAQTEGRGAP